MTAILTDAGKLSALITAIGKAGAKLDKDIQQALAGVAFQAIQHGNTDPLNRLFSGLTKGTRRTAIANWILQYCPVTQNTNKESKEATPYVLDKATAADWRETEGAEALCEIALADTWTEYSPEPDPVTAAFDIRKQLSTLLKKVAKAAEAGRTVEGIELVAALSKLCVQAEEEEFASL